MSSDNSHNKPPLKRENSNMSTDSNMSVESTKPYKPPKRKEYESAIEGGSIDIPESPYSTLNNSESQDPKKTLDDGTYSTLASRPKESTYEQPQRISTSSNEPIYEQIDDDGYIKIDPNNPYEVPLSTTQKESTYEQPKRGSTSSNEPIYEQIDDNGYIKIDPNNPYEVPLSTTQKESTYEQPVPQKTLVSKRKQDDPLPSLPTGTHPSHPSNGIKNNTYSEIPDNSTNPKDHDYIDLAEFYEKTGTTPPVSPTTSREGSLFSIVLPKKRTLESELYNDDAKNVNKDFDPSKSSYEEDAIMETKPITETIPERVLSAAKVIKKELEGHVQGNGSSGYQPSTTRNINPTSPGRA